MTTRRNYTREEWNYLESLPFLVGGFVSAVDSGFLGRLVEAFSLVPTVFKTAKRFPRNQLIQAVVQGQQAHGGGKGKAEKRFSEEADAKNVRDLCLHACRKVAEILEQKSYPAEATEFKRWVVAIGEEIANASGEGLRFRDFRSLGRRTITRRVSVKEEEALHAVREALGLPEL
uniref:Uncharacterized protein n=1 Tax=Thermosporothrix sp. COM3 TaxID=2490863 RepID=A0A455SLY3_9CHLR|nr:hypothetical protein KTC_08350 [Thermosporothrix sp. COM3]